VQKIGRFTGPLCKCMLYVQDTNKFPFPMTMEIIVNVNILENIFF